MSPSQAFAAPLLDSQDTAFTKAAHQGNLAEIAAGRDAQKNATTACVKQVAGVLVRDHSKLDGDVKMLADKLGVKLPASPTPEARKKLAAVQAKAGTAAYDKAWLADQDAAHTKTLAMIDEEISKGKNKEVVAAARAARPVVAAHLDMVRKGTCNAAGDPRKVGAGTGGHLAAADAGLGTAGAAGVAGGSLLTAGAGLWWLARRRSTGSPHSG
ncbi:DUF4142 domain-containing protein [Streptomyces sp. ISL-36]|nr:DUF4142 domain-containing protein [Streptomyces sp. ISL-36]